MRYLQKSCVLFSIAIIAGIVLRLPCLVQRPMHADEAVHAVKFGKLLEENVYQYNFREYHGPTLNYFTLIPARLGGIGKFEDLSELTLRIVPVFFGALLILMPLLLINGIGRPAALIAAALTAVSPAFVFYSRYYIHEMLLVFFAFGVMACGYRYTQSRNIRWALLAGVFVGLCHATKETCIIIFGSMLLALLLTGTLSNIKKVIKPNHLITAVVAAVITSMLLYSSFLANPGGILDCLRAYTVYFGRAGQNQLHIHPWYYYLKTLIYFKLAGGPVWSEAVIVALAAVGFIFAMLKKPSRRADAPAQQALAGNSTLIRFIAFYTAIMTVSYSVIPYKTPWCMLGFMHGMILLAAIGAAAVIKSAPNVPARVLIGLLLAAGGSHLAWQSYIANYKFYADPCNPYVYAHTSSDIFKITKRIEDIARIHPDGHKMYVEVICPDGDYWPLPWYLRRFPNVGWWSEVDENAPAAPLIIASPSVEPALIKKLYELPPPGKINLYVPLLENYMELRPRVELRGYVMKDLWDHFQKQMTGEK